MNHIPFLNSEIFAWVILPILIFIARILDVSIGTVRIIFISRGMKFIAPLLGFFEVIIWLLAVSQAMKNLTNVMCYIAYGGGFAMGTYVGMIIEDKLAIGTVAVRIITAKDTKGLIQYLQASGYGVTAVDAHGITGKVKLIFTIIKRKDLSDAVEIINRFDPKSFFSVEEIRSASEGVFPSERSSIHKEAFEQSQANKVM